MEVVPIKRAKSPCTLGSLFLRSGFTTSANLNLRPATTCDHKADRKESFDEPPRIRTDCRAMVEDRATHPEAEAFKEGREQTRRGSPALRGHPVGPSQWSTMEGSPSAVSIAGDVVAPTAGAGGWRRLAGSLKKVSRGTRRGGHPVLGRDVQRWDVLARKKGAHTSAKPNAGRVQASWP